MAITSAGIGSGLDITSLVNQLVAAEGAGPALRLDKKEANTQAEISALGTLSGAFSEFSTTLASLSTINNFNIHTATSSDTDVFTASAAITDDVQEGTYILDVTTLAQAHKVRSGTFANTSTTVGSGTFTFQFGTYASGPNTFTLNPERLTQSVTISSNENSVQGIADAVNEADIGVSATIIDDGSGPRIVFSSQFSGSANSLSITVDDDDGTDTNTSGLSQLAYDPTAAVGSGENLTETVVAQNAAFTLDGISISAESNSISTVLPGITINLLATDPGVNKTLTVTRNTGTLTTSVNSFATAYNDLITSIKDLTKYDPDTGEKGLLLGDATVRAMELKTRNIISEAVPGISGTINSLARLGVTTLTDGTLVVDSTELQDAVDDNPDSVGRIFASSGVASDSLIKFNDSTEETKAGDYLVTVSQLATQGNLVGSAAANLTITEGVNDTVSFEVDGITSTITIAAGTYTAANLAIEVQTRANGTTEFKDDDVTIAVTESSGTLTVTSDRYGSASIVKISGGNGATDLLGASPVQTDGLDVQGTIDGNTAGGTGRFLLGGGDATGLKIEVLGGGIGARGSVEYSRGIAALLEDMIESYTDSEGVVTSRNTTLNENLDDIADDREALNFRLGRLEARLLAQFTAMDALVASLKTTSDFLTQQLANLPGVAKTSNNNSTS